MSAIATKVSAGEITFPSAIFINFHVGQPASSVARIACTLMKASVSALTYHAARGARLVSMRSSARVRGQKRRSDAGGAEVGSGAGSSCSA